MKIGNKINQLRKLSGMTQEQLAEKLNVSRQTISKMGIGQHFPRLRKHR
ncbi:helix-turn-helix transcriptional regulator [Roseburia intestinalis]|nr:helix-turn-helix domain-containing protein [Roseburia intestinalis]CBL08171.1 Predicted transcriptional regulators [Roseburia intestinalis M50/1]